MTLYFLRRFDEPDETVEVGRVRSDVVTVGGATMARDTHAPGWRWSVDVKPIVGTEWCEVRHIAYTLSGRGRIGFPDGTEIELGPGEIYDVAPGHDGWVVGDEPWVSIGWLGASTWLTAAQTLRERVLVTILYTDIVDSTSRAASLGTPVWADTIAGHDQRMTDLVERHGGRIAKLTGDGVMALFDGAGRAIRCAVACHRSLSELGLILRAAVHTGEIQAVGEEWHGIAIHETARLMTSAAPGETLVSDMTRQLARDAHVTFQDRGLIEVKGLDGPIHVHSIG